MEENPLEVDYEEYGRALKFFGKTFKTLNGKPAMYKDKYNTMRWELESFWLNTETDKYHAALALLITVNKYPEHVRRLTSDPIGDLMFDFPEEIYNAIYKTER